MITSQFCVNGCVKQSEVIRAFGVTLINVKQSIKEYRAGGPRAFYQRAKGRGPSKFTPDVLAKAQSLLNAGASTAEVAEEINHHPNHMTKAISEGKLNRLKKTISLKRHPKVVVA